MSNYIQLYDIGPNYTCYPISVKDEMNRPVSNILDTMSNSEIFLSHKNIYNMMYKLVSLNTLNKTKNDTYKLQLQIPKLMADWASKNKINNINVSTVDIIQNLIFLNYKFLNDNGHLYDIKETSSINVFRTSDTVTDRQDKQYTKKYSEMTAADYHTLNLWDSNSNNIYKTNSNFRNGNKIPIYQKSMSIRNYDKSNDGLRSSTMERASLDYQMHGYDMSNIVKGIADGER